MKSGEEMIAMEDAPLLVMVGQTPPPWHGQAVATQLLFDAPWEGFDARRVRLAFSEEFHEIGRFQPRKVLHTLQVRREIVAATRHRRDGILLYPPASPHWVPVLRDLLLLPLVRKRFAKVVYLFHAGGFGEWCSASRLRKGIARLAYGKADLSLEVARESPAPHDVLGISRWAWTPYGVEVPPPRPIEGRRPGPFRVLFVGSLQEGKGVLEVLRTAALLKAQGHAADYQFRVVGSWVTEDFRNQTLALHEELGLGAMVVFPGQLTGERKWNAYAEADLFFFPTHYESEAFPLVLIEALACGLPVVTTRWRGIPDLVAECKAASLCDIHAPDQYARAIAEWNTKGEHAARFQSEARRCYVERYRPEEFIAQVKSLLGTLGSGRSGCREEDSEPCASHGFRSHRPERAFPRVRVYLADQNPGYDRSFGISRMSQVVLEALGKSGRIRLEAITSRTSQQPPASCHSNTMAVPWGTRRKFVRLLTDHLHPLFLAGHGRPDVHYFPKGYLPLTHSWSKPNVVTIHDTIIQYDEDNYPRWRKRGEYNYWSRMLRHTLRHADAIMTVSQTSRKQIEAFMRRHGLPPKPITVTYEPCLYERIPQPEQGEKRDYVMHLSSCEPHKRTAHLVKWWHGAERLGGPLPKLHLIGNVPGEVGMLVAECETIVQRPFLSDQELEAAYRGAKAIILPSEIEGFGLPALEAYYLGTPVCFVAGTSVEEILAPATRRGRFHLHDEASFWSALGDVMAMAPAEVRDHGLKLRGIYAASVVAERMLAVFEQVSRAVGEPKRA